jgi:hypothetical protein
MTTHDFYAEPNGWIPDVKLKKIAGDYQEIRAWFTWRGQDQWLKMSRDNHYGDGYFLVVETDYTEEFYEWFTEGDGQGYDSLESMFESVAPSGSFEITYEQKEGK